MSKESDTQARNYKLFCGGLASAGFVIAAIYGGIIASAKGVVSSLLVSFAAFVLGGIAGFLFGIPKTVQQDDARKEEARHGWQTNTNLEQVSDWLTKILIGVGLTQLNQIPVKLQSLGDYIEQSTGLVGSSAIVVAMVVTFAGGGFVIGYLLTKFDLGHAIDLQDGLLHDLESALNTNPTDRNTVESYMLGLLYRDPPSGFETVIQTGENFLRQEGHPHHPDDADIFAYLACAYGQKYRHKKAQKDESNLEAVRQAVLGNMKTAIEDDSLWKERFRRLTNPTLNSKDNDLEALRDDSELKALLGIEPVSGDPRPRPKEGA